MNIDFYPKKGHIKDLISRSEWVLFNEKGDTLTLKFEKGFLSALLNNKILSEYKSTKYNILGAIKRLQKGLDYLKEEIEEGKLI